MCSNFLHTSCFLDYWLFWVLCNWPIPFFEGVQLSAEAVAELSKDSFMCSVGKAPLLALWWFFSSFTTTLQHNLVRDTTTLNAFSRTATQPAAHSCLRVGSSKEEIMAQYTCQSKAGCTLHSSRVGCFTDTFKFALWEWFRGLAGFGLCVKFICFVCVPAWTTLIGVFERAGLL